MDKSLTKKTLLSFQLVHTTCTSAARCLKSSLMESWILWASTLWLTQIAPHRSLRTYFRHQIRSLRLRCKLLIYTVTKLCPRLQRSLCYLYIVSSNPPSRRAPQREGPISCNSKTVLETRWATVVLKTTSNTYKKMLHSSNNPTCERSGISVQILGLRTKHHLISKKMSLDLETRSTVLRASVCLGE